MSLELFVFNKAVEESKNRNQPQYFSTWLLKNQGYGVNIKFWVKVSILSCKSLKMQATTNSVVRYWSKDT